jgi:SAM-dependent methyltransferase
MDVHSLAWLRSAQGRALLADLAGRSLSEATLLRESSRLRQSYSAEQVRAAIELTLLRRRAAAKFPAADRLWFSRDGLEQASSLPLAAHHSARLTAWGRVADLGCGLGADTLACAQAGAHVIAVDRDPLRLALLQANAEELGLQQRITIDRRDLLTEEPPRTDALFCDPGRRAGGRRRFRVEAYEPPLSRVLSWRNRATILAVKLGPGVDPTELPDDGELEFISLNGELKEAVLWIGAGVQPVRRATLIRTRSADRAEATTLELVGVPTGAGSTSEPQDWLYEPDPAIIRAGLVAQLAQQIGAVQIDPQIAYLTGNTGIRTPFARAWRIVEWMPFQLKRLRARLRALDAGVVTVKKRGSALDTDDLARRLSGPGSQELVVVLTRVADRPVALICAYRHPLPDRV